MKKRKKELISVKEKDLNNPIKLWKDIEIVGEYAFRNCKIIDFIEIPSNIKEIKYGAFFATPIRNIQFNEGLNKIGEFAFSNCYNLEKIALPNSLEIIEEDTFKGSSVKEISFGNNIKVIGDSAFENCDQLKNVEFPNSLKKIKQKAFLGASINDVKLNEGLEEIDNLAFSNCYDLESIEFPSTIKRLGHEILRCSGVKKVYFKEGIKSISNKAFYSCNKLQSVEIPSSVDVIEEQAFDYCRSLNDIVFNEGLKKIGNFAFSNCKNLRNIEIPSSVEIIGVCAFSCTGIKKIKLNEGIRKIESGAFGDCFNLSYVEMPLGVEYIDERAFYNNYFKYLYKTQDKLILSNEVIENKDIIESYDISKIDSCFYKAMFREDYKEIYNRILYLKKIGIEYSKDCYASNEFMDKILFNDNVDFVRGLVKRVKADIADMSTVYSFYKLLYNLGGYCDDKVARQRACNFIENLFEKRKLNFIVLNEIANTMLLNGFNKEWAEFIMEGNNIYDLLIEEGMDGGFIARTYNDFDKIKELNRSNKGNQHYLKVTVEACAKYIESVGFANVSEDNKDIAMTLQKFTRYQDSFEKAVKIREEYNRLEEKNKISRHLIDEKIVDEDIYNEIQNVRKDIISSIRDTIISLKNKSNEHFTYEFLSKYDPDNYVLGKYCSCCAHIEGAGFGIMKASILHPDCENIVIRRKSGEIVAKATLYINRKQGYGVVNTIESNDETTEKEKKDIYIKIKKAIDDFVLKYNEKNKVKLKQINVGIGVTNMSNIIREDLCKGEILNGIDFSKYGDGSRTYSGDWQRQQYIIWPNNKK